MRQLLTFGGLSLVGTAAHYLVLLLWVEAAGMGAWTGSVVGATVGLLVNYLLHSRVTFASAARGPRTFARFVLSAAGGFITNAAVMAGLLAVAWHWLPAQLAATAAAFAVNYLLAKFWVFAPDTPPAP